MRKRVHAFTALAAAALAVLAVTASPSTGGTAAVASFDCNVFSPLSWLTSSNVPARGGGNVAREPRLSETYEELPASAVGQGAALDAVVTVPVWFHVVHDNGIGNVSNADINRQIKIMNDGPYTGNFTGRRVAALVREGVLIRDGKFVLCNDQS